MTRRYLLSIALLALISFVACEEGGRESKRPWLEFNWPEADQLFQRDRHWKGGDGAYSIDLSNGRVLWLFGDSWIDPSGNGKRNGAIMVSNTLAVQKGYDPSKATIEFFWTGNTSKPEAFFPDSAKDKRYWPGHGVLLDDRLILFLMDTHILGDDRGFETTGWSAVLVTNPQDDPSEWGIQWLECPENNFSIVVGSGGVLAREDYVYAFGSQEPGPHQDIYLVRWPRDDVHSGMLKRVEWWCGEISGWSRYQGAKGAVPVMGEGQSEFTVYYDSQAQHFVQTQTAGFGQAVIVQRTAEKLTGPWSAPVQVFNPPQNHFDRIMIYQGKAHPHLQGANLVLTYGTNSFEFADQIREEWLYFPRFVRSN